MATYTTNLNLKKPAQSDKIRISDLNGNADDIDAAFGEIGTASVATQFGSVESGIAIVSLGNVHAAISAGQYVYVKGHDTLSEGLYTANSAISANATLSNSNLTAVSGGGLNALNSKIEPITLSSSNNDFTFSSNISAASKFYAGKVGKVVHANCINITTGASFNSWSTIMTFAAAHKPLKDVFIPIVSGASGYIQVSQNDGSVLTSVSLPSGTTIYCAPATWVTA